MQIGTEKILLGVGLVDKSGAVQKICDPVDLKTMVDSGKKWVFRVSSGHVYGPFDIEKIEDLLLRAVLSGQEQAQSYPTGEWKGFTEYPELLGAYSRALEKSKSQKDKITETTKGKVTTRDITVKAAQPSAQKDIVLNSEKKLKAKFRLFPLLLVLISGVLFYLAANKKGPVVIQKFNLVMPQITSHSSNGAQSREFLKLGAQYFNRDTYLNYVKAEEYFVRAVEEAPENTEALMMLLCTDRELWPFVKQDSQDRAVIQWLVQKISKSDPYGKNRALASAMGASIFENEKSMGSFLDAGMQVDPSEGRFYELKAQAYLDAGNFELAKNYYDKAHSLIPAWAKIPFKLGILYLRANKSSLAYEAMVNALKLSREHPNARVEIGLLEHLLYRHEDKARENLVLALRPPSQEKLDPSTELKGRRWLAQYFKSTGDFKKALEEAEKAYQLNPSDKFTNDLLSALGGDTKKLRENVLDRPHILLADELRHRKAFMNAFEQYKEALSKNPSNASAAFKAAEVLLEMDRKEDAESFFLKASSIDKKLVSAFTQISEIRLSKFDFEGAMAVLELGLKSNPESYELFQALAQVQMKRGDYIMAEKYAQKSLQLYETDVKTNQLIAKIMLAKKDFVKALEYSKRAIQLDPHNDDAKTIFGKSKTGYEGIGGGIEYFQDLINTYPSNTNFRIGLGEILIQDEQYEEAIKALKAVLTLDTKNFKAQMLLGDAYFSMNQFEPALNHYFSAIRLNPRDPSAFFKAGETYAAMGRWGDAVRQFEIVAKVNNQYPLVHYNLAKYNFKTGAVSTAIEQLETEKKMNPRLADPWELSGDISMTQRKFQKAAQDYQKASEIRPVGAAIYIKLAKAYRGQGALDSALSMLRLAAQKESGLAEIYREQGYLFEQKGMAIEAVQSFRQYLSLELNPPDKSIILAKIKELE